MKQSIVHTALVLDDYDDAIEFYTKKIEFIKSTYQPKQNRNWVVITVNNSSSTSQLITKPSKAKQKHFVGNQADRKIFLFLDSSIFLANYDQKIPKGIEYVREAKETDYNTLPVFKN